MTYLPLSVILGLLLTGAAITLTILFRSVKAGHFSNLQSGAYVIFDEDEPVGTPQDQFFRDAPSDADSDTNNNTKTSP